MFTIDAIVNNQRFPKWFLFREIMFILGNGKNCKISTLKITFDFDNKINFCCST